MRKIFRDELIENRGGYYVEYQPADARLQFASLQLTFPNEVPGDSALRILMEKECDYWLERYAVPLMISSFDATEDLIRFSKGSDYPHLIGYVNQKTSEFVREWRSLRDNEFPTEQMGEEYQSRVYKDVPFRFQHDVRKQNQDETRKRVRTAAVIVILSASAPLLIELITLIDWVGFIASIVGISIGLFKLIKAFGWIKPSKFQEAEAAKALKMRHYFYHCERNPEAFMRLKIENFDRESIERTRREAASLPTTFEPSSSSSQQMGSQEAQ
jgi:hypothetical protein